MIAIIPFDAFNVRAIERLDVDQTYRVSPECCRPDRMQPVLQMLFLSDTSQRFIFSTDLDFLIRLARSVAMRYLPVSYFRLPYRCFALSFLSAGNGSISPDTLLKQRHNTSAGVEGGDVSSYKNHPFSR